MGDEAEHTAVKYEIREARYWDTKYQRYLYRSQLRDFPEYWLANSMKNIPMVWVEKVVWDLLQKSRMVQDVLMLSSAIEQLDLLKAGVLLRRYDEAITYEEILDAAKVERAMSRQ